MFSLSLSLYRGSVYSAVERREGRLRASGSARAREPRAGDGRTGEGRAKDSTGGGGTAPPFSFWAGVKGAASPLVGGGATPRREEEEIFRLELQLHAIPST